MALAGDSIELCSWKAPRHVVYLRFKACCSGLTRGLLKQRAGREPKEQDLNPEALHEISRWTVRRNSEIETRRKDKNLDTTKCIDH